MRNVLKRTSPRRVSVRSFAARLNRSPDEVALYLTQRECVSPPRLSANKNALRIAENSWDDPEKQFTREIHHDRPGVLEISISTEEQSGERNVGTFFLLLLNALGNSICL